MKVLEKNGELFLCWGHHELAWSRRTSGVECPFFSLKGEKIDVLITTKRAGCWPIPDGARFWLYRYWTNSGYPKHILYSLPDLRVVATFDKYTTPEAVKSLDIPQGVKDFCLRDLFEAQ